MDDAARAGPGQMRREEFLAELRREVCATVEEALAAYTSGDAYGIFAEDRRGRLKPGYQADLVLLDRDLTRIAPETIDQAAVTATVMGGKVVFERK